MSRTAVTGPMPIKCSHCSETTDQPVDRAREAGWRVGWRADHPTWCPGCFGANVRRQRQDIEPYDEPMF